MTEDGPTNPETERLKKAAEALVLHASRCLPGDEAPDWGEVSNTILLLASNPLGVVFLRACLGRVNNPETTLLVKSFINKYVAELELNAKGGKSSSWMPVVHAASVGGLLTAGIAVATGTLTLPLGVVIVGFLGVSSVSTTVYRARQFSLDAHYKRDADLVKAMLGLLP